MAIDRRTGTTTTDLWPPGTEPAVEHTTDIDDWLAVIASGRCVGITPESTVTQYRRQGIAFRPLRDADPVPVWCIWRARSPTRPPTPPSPRPRSCTAGGVIGSREPGCSTDPTLGTVRDQPQQHPWPGSSFGGEPRTVRLAEIASRDGRSRRGDVALDQLGLPLHLQAAERPDSLEDDQHTAWVAGQVAQLHVTLSDHDLQGLIGPAKPYRHCVRAAVLAIGRQHCRSGRLQQRPHPFDPKLGSSV